MNNPIAKALKTLAGYVSGLEALGAVITGGILMADDELVLGFGILLGGLLTAFISFYLLAGFGELIENVSAIKRKLCRDETPVQKESLVDYANIAKLKKLRADGLISEEEYNQLMEKEGII